MKFFRFTAVIFAAFIFFGAYTVCADKNDVYSVIDILPNYVTLVVDGLDVSAPNFVHEGTTYIPLRRMAELLGKDVKWDEESNTVTIEGKRELDSDTSFEQEKKDMDELADGVVDVIADGVSVNLDGIPIITPNYVYKDRTYVPLRVISEGFKNDVAWDETMRTVNIKSPEYISSLDVAAVIGGEEYTVGDLRYLISNEIEIYDSYGTTLPNEELRKTALEYAKLQQYIIQKTVKVGIVEELNDIVDVQLQMQSILDNYGEVTFLDGLRTAKIGIDGFKKALIRDFIIQKYISSDYLEKDELYPDDEETEKFYNTKKEEYQIEDEYENLPDQTKEQIKWACFIEKAREASKSMNAETKAQVFDNITF